MDNSSFNKLPVEILIKNIVPYLNKEVIESISDTSKYLSSLKEEMLYELNKYYHQLELISNKNPDLPTEVINFFEKFLPKLDINSLPRGNYYTSKINYIARVYYITEKLEPSVYFLNNVGPISLDLYVDQNFEDEFDNSNYISISIKIDEADKPVLNGLTYIKTTIYKNNKEIYMKEREWLFSKGKQIYFKKILAHDYRHFTPHIPYFQSYEYDSDGVLISCVFKNKRNDITEDEEYILFLNKGIRVKITTTSIKRISYIDMKYQYKQDTNTNNKTEDMIISFDRLDIMTAGQSIQSKEDLRESITQL